jgi:hypothetical protein
MNATENIRFGNAVIMFKDVDTQISFREADTSRYAFGVTVDCWHLDWQVSSMAQISNPLTQVLSVVERLTLEYEVHSRSSEEHHDVDRVEWRNLLRSFCNVKILRVEDGLVEKLSHCLRLEDGEHPLELLPELQELTYSESRNTGDAFTSFIDARQKAGRPVTLVRHKSGISMWYYDIPQRPSVDPSPVPLYSVQSTNEPYPLGFRPQRSPGPMTEALPPSQGPADVQNASWSSVSYLKVFLNVPFCESV